MRSKEQVAQDIRKKVLELYVSIYGCEPPENWIRLTEELQELNNEYITITGPSNKTIPS